MRVTVIFRERSDHARGVHEFIELVERRYPGKRVHTLELDSRSGAAEATLYDIKRYPAILVTRPNGSIAQLWEGLPLPLVDEIGSLIKDD